MNFDQVPNLKKFFNLYCMDSSISDDPRLFIKFLNDNSSEFRTSTIDQLKRLISSTFSMEEFGSEANRWFEDETQARAWLESLQAAAKEMQTETDTDTGLIVKDSNGAVFAEGDSAVVIQDLKVKGGSSDLKRGTPIKKIHLIGDSEAVECRVDGSVLVLKTKFLRKV